MRKTIAGLRAGNRNNRVKNAKNDVFTGKNAGECEDMLYAVQGEACSSASPETPELAPAPWMSPDLIAETHAVWSKRYGRSLAPSEVIEILTNIRWFGELMRRGMNGEFQ